MKFILLAAATMIAAPALAQQTTGGSTTPGTVPGSAPITGTTMPTQSGTDMQDGMSTETTDPSMQTMPNSTMPSNTMPANRSMSTMPANNSMSGDPVGGYQPATPPMSGPMQPGANVTFQPSQSPDQAYPAPAPLDHYPICKRGQTDKCMQRGG